MTVWLIEDDAGIADALRDFLGRQRVRRGAVWHAGRCAPCADRCAAGCHTCLTGNLPDGEGAAFCRELRAQDAQLPVLLLTVAQRHRRYAGRVRLRR